MPGMAIAVCRATPPTILGVPAGHTGWIYQLDDGTFLGGATEAYVGVLPVIAAGANNNAWQFKFATLEAALADFAGNGHYNHPPYDWWKAYEVDEPNFETAIQQAYTNVGRGWWIPGNDCLDHATDVLAAYGVPWQQLGGQPADGMPWKQTHPAPIDWFHWWQVPEHPLRTATPGMGGTAELYAANTSLADANKLYTENAPAADPTPPA